MAVGEVATWIFGVAAWKSHYGQKRGRDMKLMSRHRVISRRVRPRLGVATWPGQGLGQSGRDLDFDVATSARPASARPALAVPATCTRPACCERSSAHNLGTARAMCARPGFWVCVMCTQPSFVTVHCLGSLFGHCSWTLFTGLKKKYKIFKICLVYDLKYKIFILKLL